MDFRSDFIDPLAQRAFGEAAVAAAGVVGEHTRVLIFPQCGYAHREKAVLHALRELVAGGLADLLAVVFMDAGMETPDVVLLPGYADLARWLRRVAPRLPPASIAILGVHACSFRHARKEYGSPWEYAEYLEYLETCAALPAVHPEYVNFRHLTHAVDFFSRGKEEQEIPFSSRGRAFGTLVVNRQPWVRDPAPPSPRAAGAKAARYGACHVNLTASGGGWVTRDPEI